MSIKKQKILTKRIFTIPAILLISSVVLYYVFATYLGNDPFPSRMLVAFIWFSMASIVNRGIHLFFWQPLREVQEVVVPGMLINLMTGIIWLVTCILVLSFVFEIPITGIVTTSTVAMGVSGLALRDFIADLFAGVVISIERMIRIGDWIDVDGKYVGRVVEISSRSTRLVNNDELTLVVPNSQITRLPVRNYSYPEKYWRDKLNITLGYEVTFHQARRILLGAVHAIPELASVPRTPSVNVVEHNDRGVLWSVLYWIPDYGSRSSLAARLHQNILRNLHYADIRCPYPRQVVHDQDVTFSGENAADLVPLLRKNPLFSLLTEEELLDVARYAERTTCEAKHVVIRQGDLTNAQLFILHEGLLSVQIDGKVVGQLSAGSIFGEMSMLTGEPRGSTVTAVVDSSVIEISKDVMDRLLRHRPELVTIVGDMLAKRQLANRRIAEQSAMGVDVQESEKRTLADQITKRIRNFFGL